MKKIVGVLLTLILMINMVFSPSIVRAEENLTSSIKLGVEEVSLSKQSAVKPGDIVNVKISFLNESENNGENIRFDLDAESKKSFKLVSDSTANRIKNIKAKESQDLNISIEVLEEVEEGSHKVGLIAFLNEKDESITQSYFFNIKVEKATVEEVNNNTPSEPVVNDAEVFNSGGGGDFIPESSNLSSSGGDFNGNGQDTTTTVIKGGKPKLIVDNYTVSPNPVKAGEDFDLTLSFYNTNKKKAVKNIKIVINSSGGTSMGTGDDSGDNPNTASPSLTGSVFMPVNSSNTFYIESIGAGKRVSKNLKLTTPYNVNPNTYELNVHLEYDDSESNEFISEEALGINVYQEAKIQLGTINFMDPEVGMPSDFSVEFYNTGRSPIHNLMIKVSGNFDVEGDTYYVGDFHPGSTESFSAPLTAMEAGEVKGKLLITYEDSTGKPHELEQEFSATAIEINMEEDPDFMVQEEKTSIFKNPVFWIIIALIVVVIIVIVVRFNKKNKELDDELIINDDELENLDIEEKKEDEKDNIENTQLIDKGNKENEDK